MLIGVNGQVVLEGEVEPLKAKFGKGSYKSRLAAALKKEQAKRKNGWGEHRAIRNARKSLFGNGRIAQAWKLLESLDSEEHPEVDVVREEVKSYVARREAAIRRLTEEGYYTAAQDQLASLSASVRGADSLTSSVKKLADEFADQFGSAEKKAEQNLEKLLRLVRQRKFKKLEFEDLARVRAFVKKHKDRPIGIRAERESHLVKRLLATTRGIQWTKFEATYKKEMARR